VPRFRRKFGRRPKKPTDWITTLGGYGLNVEPLAFPDNTINLTTLVSNRDVTLPLDALTRLAEQPSRYYEFELTVIRIVGKIFCWVAPSTNWWETLTGRTQAIFRLVQTKIFIPGVGGQDVMPSVQYLGDLRHSTSGSDDFMWEDVQLFIAQSAWGDLTVDPSLYVREIPVDCRVKRRLQKGDALAVYCQWGPGIDYGGELEVFPDLFVDYRLRVLTTVHTMK